MRCAHCGAALGPAAAWCGLCHAAVTAPVAELAYAAPAAPEYAASAARAALAGGYGPPAPPAWPAPPGWPAPTAPPAPAWTPRSAGPPLPWTPLPGRPESTRKAGRTVLAAIGVGVLSRLVMAWVTSSHVVENEAGVRYALCLTLGVYAVVAVIVIRRLAGDSEPLHWRGSWHPLASIALGLSAGGGLAYALMSSVSAAGRQGGDSRVALLVSEGDLPHILVTLLITVVAAPVLEELLFRGLLLPSLAHRGRRLAIWWSAVAFAAWHLSASGLVYYSLIGVLLAWLFLKKGLFCSMAAHAAFNGVLSIAAISYALTPGPVAWAGRLQVHAPHGWHTVTDEYPVHLSGPSMGEIVAADVALPGATQDPNLMADRLAHGAFPAADGFAPRLATVRVIRLRIGGAVSVTVTVDGRDGEMVMLPHPDGVYLVVLVSGGSPRVRADFEKVLDGLTIG